MQLLDSIFVLLTIAVVTNKDIRGNTINRLDLAATISGQFNFMEEIWKDVPGYEKYYKVSNYGKVIAKSRVRNHWKGGKAISKEKAMSPALNSRGKGYYQVNLKNDNGQKCFFIHQLVMLSFVGESNGKVIDHINMNTKDNRLCNLEYVTQKENMVRAYTLNRGNYSSKYVGVSFEKRYNKWHSYSQVNSNKRKHLGYFNCETKAMIERQKFNIKFK
jgi:hypothetical protein